jgi:hypothetical protein
MSNATLPIECEIELRPGEKLCLPETVTGRVGAGRWLVTVQPAEQSDATRVHQAFLDGYSPEDEGLYDDAAAR